MNSVKIAAALRALADAFETPAETADLPPEQPAATSKRGRGRPVKGEDTSSPAAAAEPSKPADTAPTSQPSAPAEDPFAATTPAAPVATLEEVRVALKALAAATSQAIALGVLKDAGGKAANLTELKSELYGAVVQAATAALPPIKTEPTVEADPFDAPAAAGAPAVKPLTLEDVKAAVVETQKRTSQDTVQKVVMDHGGKAAKQEGGFGPSLKALPESAFAATIAALKALPATK